MQTLPQMQTGAILMKTQILGAEILRAALCVLFFGSLCLTIVGIGG